jgi:hypothetical protein
MAKTELTQRERPDDGATGPTIDGPVVDGVERKVFTNWKAVIDQPSKQFTVDMLDNAGALLRGRGDRPDMTVVTPKQFARAKRGECMFCGVLNDSDEHRESACFRAQLADLERRCSWDSWFDDRGIQ